MSALWFTLFDTSIGQCGIAWGANGIVGLQLPEAHENSTRRRLLRRFPTAREATPTPDVQRACEGIIALLRGEARDLSDVPLDLRRVPTFDRRVYEVVRTIAAGATLSYGEVAERLGARELARDVGQALARNPFAIVVPCHRVLAANGKIGGFSAHGGTTTKRRMLAIEQERAIGALRLFADPSPS